MRNSASHDPILQAITEAGAAGTTANELRARFPSVPVAQLYRVLHTLQVREHRIIRRYEWIETGPAMGQGWRQYRYWAQQFFIDASQAPICRDAAGRPMAPTILLRNFNPTIET